MKKVLIFAPAYNIIAVLFCSGGRTLVGRKVLQQPTGRAR